MIHGLINKFFALMISYKIISFIEKKKNKSDTYIIRLSKLFWEIFSLIIKICIVYRSTSDIYIEREFINFGPDAAPSDYDVFRSMQYLFKCRQLESFNESWRKMTIVFGFQRAAMVLPVNQNQAERWQKVVDYDGLCFEEYSWLLWC